jgi:type IV pilus assembly protein PilB
MLKALGVKESERVKLYRGKGCRECKESGYSGRNAIFELLIVSDRIRELVTQKASAGAIRQEAVKSGMETMRVNGLKKAEEGITTVEEVLRATQED